MTNNPTIDGVSRELLADLVKLASRNVRSAWGGGVCEEARALLDTPPNDLREHCKQCAEVVKTWPEWKQSCLGGAPAVERKEPEFPAGAIHNGRAFIDQLESTYAFKEQQGHPLSLCSEWQELVRCFEWLATHATEAQATMAQLQARVQELENGSGEPVAWTYKREGGEVLDQLVQMESDDLKCIRLGKCHDDGTRYMWPREDYTEWKPLYAAPPAPVAVVLPEFGSTPLDHLRGLLELVVDPGTYPVSVLHNQIRATLATMHGLDATAALNGLAK